MSGKYHLYRYLLLTIIIVTAGGCSIEKNTRTTRFYNSLTSRYNIYFNGNESFKAGAAKVSASYKDDYSELLRVFEYSDPEAVKIAAADMETAVKKASKVISLKSMSARPEQDNNKILTPEEEEFLNRREYNDWVEKSYLLMGKARFYLRDFDMARLTLSYNISNAYIPEVRTETSVWLAKVYLETGNFNEAQRILRETKIKSEYPAHIAALYYTSLADLYIRQNNFSEAASNLEKGLKYVSGKRNRYRLTFLLAQLYAKTGRNDNASFWFRKVIGMNPPYEVEFNARINLAGAYNSGGETTGNIKRELVKMTRNPKNSDYLDQIYYALAGISMKEGKTDEAVSYYKKSASVSKTNQNQKGKSFLAIAEYYYSIPDYLSAGLYYDSALFFLNNKFPDFESLKSKSSNLNKLVTQLSIIQREDSLRKVAAMSPAERGILIASIIDNVRRAEAEAASAGMSAGSNYNLGQYYENERRFQVNIEQEGKWYFYNQAALTFGRTEFRRRWGDRKLEDNWRRMNKGRITPGEQSERTGENGNGLKKDSVKIADNKTPEFYLRDLPLNDSLIRISDQRIAMALLEAGKIYNENFSDRKKAVETLETISQRFPGNATEPEALYNIFKIYREENNNQMAEVYRQRLVEKYPENEFTKSITDPDYYTRQAAKALEAERLYNDAYNAYLSEDFSLALRLCETGTEKFPKHELSPKFLLLRSFCMARLSGEKAYRDELSELIKLWPGTPEANRAAELIAFLDQEIPELKTEEDKEVAREIYSDDKTSPQIFALVIPDPSFNINQATFDIISYNIDRYTNRNFRTSGTLIDDKYIMITVTGFRNFDEAVEYYLNLRVESEIRNQTGAKMIKFLIGTKNMEILEKDKNPERYHLFFLENYPEATDKK